jgi:hypothetical protein
MKHKLVPTVLLVIALAVALMGAPPSAHASGGHWMSDNFYYDFVGGQWQRTQYFQWQGLGYAYNTGYLWQLINGQWRFTWRYFNGHAYPPGTSELDIYMANCSPFGCR